MRQPFVAFTVTSPSEQLSTEQTDEKTGDEKDKSVCGSTTKKTG
jgi:hypothetical protein